ncbi:cation:proton antiporter [bacterium]|nr:cation:proton antiporter [bacterium]
MYILEYIRTISMPILLLIGITILISFYVGKTMKYIKLPSIIGYMFVGVLLGPSLLNLLHSETQESLSFITEIALGFVAISIGIELNFASLRKLGKGIIFIIFAESFGAFILVFSGVYFLTDNLPMALIFGSIAPASAPAGTVAIIQEYKAKGSLTKALFAIVGFDDGLGIIIFGFAAAIARSLLMQESGGAEESFMQMLSTPLLEVFLSLVVGVIGAFAFAFLARKLTNKRDILILVVTLVLVVCGLSQLLHLSLILTNMIIGMVIVNTQPHSLTQSLHDKLPVLMPILFILFFTLAGANLHIAAIPTLGALGVVYILTRSIGLVGGSRIGAMFGHVEEKIKKYVGMGILSQAGVAIGLALIVKHEFKDLGKMIDGLGITTGEQLGIVVITTITASSIFFEIIGPILTKIALTKAGEISPKN